MATLCASSSQSAWLAVNRTITETARSTPTTAVKIRPVRPDTFPTWSTGSGSCSAGRTATSVTVSPFRPH